MIIKMLDPKTNKIILKEEIKIDNRMINKMIELIDQTKLIILLKEIMM